MARTIVCYDLFPRSADSEGSAGDRSTPRDLERADDGAGAVDLNRAPELQHDVADDLRRHRTRACRDRDLRLDVVLGRAKHARHRSPPRARRRSQGHPLACRLSRHAPGAHRSGPWHCCGCRLGAGAVEHAVRRARAGSDDVRSGRRPARRHGIGGVLPPCPPRDGRRSNHRAATRLPPTRAEARSADRCARRDVRGRDTRTRRLRSESARQRSSPPRSPV
jgi:hypothetical protein